jgi:hypothetical protein
MDTQALQELISLFLKINPAPSDQQFHALAEAVGVDKETLESVAYEMLGDAEDLLEDGEFASSTHSDNDSAIDRLGANIYADKELRASIFGINARARLTASEDAGEPAILDDPTIDPDEQDLSDVALNDGDPTGDDLGMQEETLDDGYTEKDIGVGLTNNTSDVLNDDGAPDLSIP